MPAMLSLGCSLALGAKVRWQSNERTGTLHSSPFYSRLVPGRHVRWPVFVLVPSLHQAVARGTS